MNRVDQVPQIAAQAVKFPDKEGIASPKCFQADSQAGPVIPLAGGRVFIDVLGNDPGSK